ncbi:MAG: PAS domain S-box protein [Acidimicrobiia bacterium]
MTESSPARLPSLAVRAVILSMGSFLALVAAIGALVVLENRQELQDRQVAHTFEVLTALQHVRSLLIDAETGMRGYLLTDDDGFLAPYHRARAELGPAMDELSALVSDNALQSERMVMVRRAADRRMDLVANLVETTPDDAERLRELQFGRALMDGIRIDLDRMEDEERRLLEERITVAEDTRSLLAAVIPVAGIVAFLGLGSAIVFATRMTRRIGRMTENARRLGRGEALLPMQSSSDEIGQLGDALIDAAALLRSREDELRSTREFLEYLIESGPVVMFRKRLDTEEMTYLSPNAERVLGVRPQSAVGRKQYFSSLLDPEHREAFMAGVRAAAEGRIDGWYGEYQTAADDGGERWVAVEVRVHRHADEPPYLLGYVIDITDRIAASQAARSAEEQYAALFERTPTGIIKATMDGAIVEANAAFAHMFGYESPDQLKHEITDVSDLYADSTDRRRLIDALERAERLADFEVRMRRRDGTVIDITLNAAIVRNSSGEPVGLEGTAIDVTARRKAEEKARRAQAEADRANQAKSIFLSRMSHELRTPLNSIIGFAQLLDIAEPPLDDRARESVSHILKAGRHLLSLIDEVLDIAQVEAGRLNMSLEPIEADDAVAESIDLIRPLATARRLTVTADDATCAEHVLADRQRLKQVLLNLFSNAVKYNHPGGSIVVECETVDDMLAISVTDTGPGISPDQQERLFTPFDRLGAEQSEEQGTGLGLVLSRHLVEAMGGTLTVASVVGEGSTFTVTLPRSGPPTTNGRHRPEALDTVPVGDGSTTRNVIYIEDNLANLRLIERILALRPNIRLDAAMQGRLGLDLIHQHRPDLVLLDLNLPDMEGRDVLVELQADPTTRSIPVLVISADASGTQIQRLLDAGAAGYVTKPVDVVELLTRVDELLN